MDSTTEPEKPQQSLVDAGAADKERPAAEINDDDIDDLFEDHDDNDEDDKVPGLISQPKSSHPHKPSANTSASIDDQVASLARHAGKIRLTGRMTGASGGNARDKDKADRATTEQVLDRRTQMILLQLINRGVISEIHGVISTGKEANVYHAMTEPSDADADPIHRAVKVYKTSILVFKDRAKYVEGEFRFRQGYNKSNNRAMVRMWADKERRNLARIHDAGIPSPQAHALRNHVLVMGFVGDRKGKAAPRLKDVRFEGLTSEEEDAKWTDLYLEMLAYMRIMYQTCRLVHADLSEYNVLYHEGKQWIIDVSQAVEHDHPRSLEFLRMDVKNVSDFFRSRNVEVLSERKAYAFITSAMGPKDVKEQQQIQDLIRTLLNKEPLTEEQKKKEEEDDDVFRNQYIPQTLDQVYDIERDAELVNAGGGSDLPYQALLADKVVNNESDASNPDADSGDDSSDTSEVDQSIFDKGPSRGKKHIDHDEKVAHKKAIKEEKREKRKEKMPKHMKKKLTSQTGRKK
ncbi:Serine/threonine-protein kinase RIO1 [Pyrenophora tritici-repentis]|uniref:Serine/threonine-protein kinase RIO1 n=2 Tax=Pyrenophora tritici-repentis TaxID=45151 RepID=A0A922T354_9PLEO|nr:serine/threonine-protein kinase RIO3 [Pyrenophora tritici-repentis Pt-1C-BFP]EDU39768.1 serine/threonine-protein kinase RIO3 [Pyrenophora tritici-repentis Pt-1C-BFP]KAI1520210.1 Serine/threonine-protein kinase RIO1 [Pyrenophora tritici-repentis]KAI1675411.1 Serine/threonine-protein kinase RIO1 [Pyrenophora tritici-repentis]KAI1687432.1 Serine/threonine-protein kinase RIO1 [Pyrenophora tritici-repentis]